MFWSNTEKRSSKFLDTSFTVFYKSLFFSISSLLIVSLMCYLFCSSVSFFSNNSSCHFSVFSNIRSMLTLILFLRSWKTSSVKTSSSCILWGSSYSILFLVCASSYSIFGFFLSNFSISFCATTKFRSEFFKS